MTTKDPSRVYQVSSYHELEQIDEYANLITALMEDEPCSLTSVHRCRYNAVGNNSCNSCPGHTSYDPWQAQVCNTCGAPAVLVKRYDSTLSTAVVLSKFICAGCGSVIYSCGFGDIMAYRTGSAVSMEDII